MIKHWQSIQDYKCFLHNSKVSFDFSERTRLHTTFYHVAVLTSDFLTISQEAGDGTSCRTYLRKLPSKHTKKQLSSLSPVKLSTVPCHYSDLDSRRRDRTLTLISIISVICCSNSPAITVSPTQMYLSCSVLLQSKTPWFHQFPYRFPENGKTYASKCSRNCSNAKYAPAIKTVRNRISIYIQIFPTVQGPVKKSTASIQQPNGSTKRILNDYRFHHMMTHRKDHIILFMPL